MTSPDGTGADEGVAPSSSAPLLAEKGATATLEFTVQTDRGLRAGFIPGLTAAEVADVKRDIHFREVIADHLDPLPLCWVADGKRRGATVEEWEISFDHEALPTFAVIDVKSFVTCDDCKEWLHA